MIPLMLPGNIEANKECRFCVQVFGFKHEIPDVILLGTIRHYNTNVILEVLYTKGIGKELS